MNIAAGDVELIPIVASAEWNSVICEPDWSRFPVLFDDSGCSSLRDAFSKRRQPEALGRIVIRVQVGGSNGDVIVATPDSCEEMVAKRYALVTRRRYVAIDLRKISSHPEFPNFDSITLFAPPDLTELPRWLSPCRGERPGKGILKVGVISAQTLAKWTQVAARQLLALYGSWPLFSTPYERSDLLFLGTNYTGRGSQIELVENSQLTSTGRELACLLQSWQGTVFLNAHSRPHCGILPNADGAIGLCGLESGGSDGSCVHGTACLFSDSPIVNLRKLQCTNLFFNGCTTAAVASYRKDFLPSEALIAQAVCESGVCNFIGNDRAGHFGEIDQLWFMAACALGFRAAEAVCICDQYRVHIGHESEGSAVLFGDALSPPWPSPASSIGTACDDGEDALLIEWESGKRLLVAALVGRKWARLAKKNLVDVQTNTLGLNYVGILENPWADQSIFLAVTDSIEVAGPLTIRLITLETAAEVAAVGEKLALTNRGLSHSLLLPRFADALPVDRSAISQHVVRMRRAKTQLANLAYSRSLFEQLLEEEKSLVAQIDSALLKRCLDLAQERWIWHEDFASLESEGPARIDAACPACGAVASVTQSSSLADQGFSRETIACGFCGIVSDWPWPQLRIKINNCEAESALVAGTIAIANRGLNMREVQLGMSLRGCPSDEEESSRRFTCALSPGSVHAMRYRLTAATPKSGLMQLLLFAVSHGQIGVRSRMIFVGRHSDLEKIAHPHYS